MKHRVTFKSKIAMLRKMIEELDSISNNLDIRDFDRKRASESLVKIEGAYDILTKRIES